MKILIVEDNAYCLEQLRDGVKKIVPNYFELEKIDMAPLFEMAKNMIEHEIYDIIFLDNILLDTKDTELYGYALIDLIRKRNKKTIVIGTSSSLPSELKKFKKPDFQVDYKDSKNEALDLLTLVLEKLKQGLEREEVQEGPIEEQEEKTIEPNLPWYKKLFNLITGK